MDEGYAVMVMVVVTLLLLLTAEGKVHDPRPRREGIVVAVDSGRGGEGDRLRLES